MEPEVEEQEHDAVIAVAVTASVLLTSGRSATDRATLRRRYSTIGLVLSAASHGGGSREHDDNRIQRLDDVCVHGSSFTERPISVKAHREIRRPLPTAGTTGDQPPPERHRSAPDRR